MMSLVELIADTSLELFISVIEEMSEISTGDVHTRDTVCGNSRHPRHA